MKTKTRTKAKASKKRHPAASRSKSHRKSMRGTSSRVKKAAPALAPMLVEEETVIESVRSEPPYDFEADKREEELSDEEILDREEKQHLY